MIQYRRSNSTNMLVYVGNATVGSIRSVTGGYQYYPYDTTFKYTGKVYLTVGQVKQSLEEDEK